MKDTKIRKVKYKGELDLAGYKMPCYVLEDGTRVLSGRGMQEALKMVDEVESGKETAGSRLDRYLNQSSLKCFLYKDKKPDHYDPIVSYDGEKKIHGFKATLLPDFCDGILEARKEARERKKKKERYLSPRQEIIAKQCEIIIRAFAKVGIIALVDEATGYQYERERFELQEVLRTHVLKGKLFLKWRETFSLDYYKELYGVYDVPFTPEKIRRKPRFIGYLTNELVYKNLPKGEEILKKIKERTPKTKGGNPKKRQHQSLTKKVGREALIDVIATVRTLAKLSKRDRNKFRRLVKEMYHLDRDLPYIDVEAMDDNKKETKVDKVLGALLKTPVAKKKKGEEEE